MTYRHAAMGQCFGRLVLYQSNNTTTLAHNFVLARLDRVVSRNKYVAADSPVEPGQDGSRVGESMFTTFGIILDIMRSIFLFPCNPCHHLA
jgi:hypothetical protein